MKDKSLQLINIGVDVAAVVKRLGGDEDLYYRICSKFITDNNHQLLRQSIDKEDYKSAETFAHTLKGVAANLGFLRLEQVCENILNLLRSNALDNLPIHISCLTEEYQRILSILKNTN